MLSSAEANERAADLHKTARTEWARLRRFVRYARGKQPLPWLPDDVESEYRDIARKSASNWLDLVIRATTQGLIVSGYGDQTESSVAWDQGWQPNGMDARQHSFHHAIEALGYGHLIVLPSDGGVWMRPEAATSMFAEFDDPNDEWPDVALRVVKQDRTGSQSGVFELYDDEARYTITGDLGRGAVDVFEHGTGVCPVVQMSSEFNLLGAPMGQIEPVITIQDRIVDATFTLQMVAKYGAFPQRWISGMSVANKDGDGEELTPQIRAYIDHILVAADPDTKFGQFAAADLRQYVDALEAHIRHLAAITQTPPHYLLGALVNLSADALAAAESGLQRKIREKQEVLGEGYEQALRLAAAILGDGDAAMDVTSQVHWQDVGARSLSQTADALVKLKDVGVPARKLFEMIPGWTKTDADDAADMVQAGDPIDRLLAEIAVGQPSPNGVDA